MQQQVSSYLLQWLICQKDPPSARGGVWQDTPGNSVSKRDAAGRGAALPSALQSKPQPNTRCAGPSIAPKGTVRREAWGHS